MATKIYCAAIDCEYYRDKDGRCMAKEICLSDHSVMTAWNERQRFQKCKTYQKSQQAIELEEKFKPILEKFKTGDHFKSE